MYPYFYKTIFLFLITSSLTAQGLMVSQIDHIGQSIYDIEVLPSGEVWATGQNKILYSSNQGNNWIEIDFFDIHNTLEHIVPFSDQHFLVAGDGVYITYDQGENWEQVDDLYSITSKENFGETIFLNSKDNGIFKSLDAGLSWSSISPEDYSPSTGAMSFISETIGFVSHPDGHLLKTTNGGESWNTVTPTPFDEEIELIAFKNEMEGMIKASDILYQTLDGGNSWVQFLDGASQTRNLFATDSGFYDIDGSRVRVLQGIEEWEYLTNDDINDIDYSLDYEEVEGTQYITGNGMVLRKELPQELEQWVDLTPGPNNGFERMSINDGNIFITGNQRFQYSSDNGNNFIQGKVSGFSQDREVFIDSNGDLYTCDIQVRRSANNGQDWEYITQGSSLHKLSDNRLLMGSSSSLVSSSDFGLTLDTIIKIPHPIRDVYFYDDDFGWLTTNSVNSYRSFDGGNSWEEIVQDFRSPDEIQFVSKEVGFGINDFSSFLFKTTNQGTDWEQINLVDMGVNIRLTSLIFIDENNGFISGEVSNSPAGIIYRTKDGGASWTEFQLGYDVIHDLTFNAEQDILWAVGSSGQLYKYSGCTDLEPTLSLDDNRLTCNESSSNYKWYLNESFYKATSEPFIDLVEEGNYTVYITGDNDCTSSSSELVNFSNTTSTQLNNLGRSIRLFPNPVVDGSCQIDINNFDHPQLILYGPNGQQINVKLYQEDGIAYLDDLVKGIYILRLEDQKSFANIKIIVL